MEMSALPTSVVPLSAHTRATFTVMTTSTNQHIDIDQVWYEVEFAKRVSQLYIRYFAGINYILRFPCSWNLRSIPGIIHEFFNSLWMKMRLNT